MPATVTSRDNEEKICRSKDPGHREATYKKYPWQIVSRQTTLPFVNIYGTFRIKTKIPPPENNRIQH